MHYLDKFSSPHEVDSILIMFLHACADSEDVGVKDDVIGVKSYFVDQQLVSSSADLHFAVCICGLERTECLSTYTVNVSLHVCLLSLTCPSSSKAITTTAAP